MLIVHVDIAVDPGRVDEFQRATIENATASIQEPGVVRFDAIQDAADPAHVVLVEIYRDADAAAAHKATPHYATWRDTVADMMARPRSSTKYGPVFPVAEADWSSHR
ncbi:MAG TPA: putative quinol monooxygenase [Nakamurella sp.]